MAARWTRAMTVRRGSRGGRVDAGGERAVTRLTLIEICQVRDRDRDVTAGQDQLVAGLARTGVGLWS